MFVDACISPECTLHHEAHKTNIKEVLYNNSAKHKLKHVKEYPIEKIYASKVLKSHRRCSHKNKRTGEDAQAHRSLV